MSARSRIGKRCAPAHSLRPPRPRASESVGRSSFTAWNPGRSKRKPLAPCQGQWTILPLHRLTFRDLTHVGLFPENVGTLDQHHVRGSQAGGKKESSFFAARFLGKPPHSKRRDRRQERIRYTGRHAHHHLHA